MIDLGQVGVGLPVPLVDQVEQPRAVRPGFEPKTRNSACSRGLAGCDPVLDGNAAPRGGRARRR